MTADVTVITPSLPEREPLLAHAMASVRAQTLQPAAHLVGVDTAHRGGARMLTLLASAVTTEWTAILADDDVFYPRHLERLRDTAQVTGASVVYSWCDVTGPDPWEQYNQPFDPAILRRCSIVGHNALIRTDLVVELGGWPAEQGYDWRFWVRALDAGARFACVSERTWRYNLDGGMWHESRPWLGAA